MPPQDPISTQEPRKVSIEELREVFGSAAVPFGIAEEMTPAQREELRRSFAWQKSLPDDPDERLRALAEHYGGLYLPNNRPCKVCGKPLPASSRQSKVYCSRACKVADWRKMNPERAAAQPWRQHQKERGGSSSARVEDRESIPA